jgi:hypothetical protein
MRTVHYNKDAYRIAILNALIEHHPTAGTMFQELDPLLNLILQEYEDWEEPISISEFVQHQVVLYNGAK